MSMLNVKRGFLWWKPLQLLSDFPGLCSATMFLLTIQVFHLHLVCFRSPLPLYDLLHCFQPQEAVFSKKKKKPPKYFYGVVSAAQHPPGEHVPFLHWTKTPQSYLLTSGFRRCCEWVQSPALIGCDGNTTPVWSCKCSPFVKCDSTVHIEVQAAAFFYPS